MGLANDGDAVRALLQTGTEFHPTLADAGVD